MVPKKIGDFSEYREVTGTPRGSNGPYWAIGERRSQATRGGVRPPREFELDKAEGRGPPFLSFGGGKGKERERKKERRAAPPSPFPIRTSHGGALPFGLPPLLPYGPIRPITSLGGSGNPSVLRKNA